MDDWQLLEDYAARNSDEAFRALVERYAGVVYHSALRQVRNPHTAEEVTQAVFIALAHKAGRLPKKTVLSGWLVRATRFAVLNHARQENRRRRHEQEAFAMKIDDENSSADSVWDQVSPHLDDALNRLSAADRDALTIHYLENRSHKQVAAALGLSEDTARRRVSRAVQKLRTILARRGTVVPAAALAAAFAAHGAQAAPSGLVSTVTLAAAAKGSAGSAGTVAAAKGILKLMAWAKLKTAAIVGVAALLAAGTTAVVLEQTHIKPGEPLEGTVTLPDGTPAANVTVYLCLYQDFLDLSPDGRLGPEMVTGPNGQPQVIRGYATPASVQTGPDGRFVFQTWKAPAWVLATDDRGFALLSASNLTRETPMTLLPLATITGTLFVGAKPATNEIVRVTPVNPDDPYDGPFWGNLQVLDFKVGLWGAHVRTDAEGRFSFRVPAGDYWVNRNLGLMLTSFGGGGNANDRSLTEGTPVRAEWGKTNAVKVGGEGRTVVGQLAGVMGAVPWTNQIYFVEKIIPGPGPKPDGMSGQDNWKRVEEWRGSPAGQAALWSFRRYVVQTEPDGRFRIQDVPPGEYELHFPLSKTYIMKRGGAAQSLDLADASIKFKIEPVAPGHDPDADPLDLGLLQRDWITNYLNLWIKDDELRPEGQPPRAGRVGQRRGGPDPGELAALEEQVKSRQSVKGNGKETMIDLSPYVTAKLTEPLGEDIFIKDNTLAELPGGLHVFGGVPFNVSGLVQLNSSVMYPYVRPLPEEKKDIAIGLKFKRLHILNGSVVVRDALPPATINRGRRAPGPLPAAEAIAKLVLHYADGSQAELPIVPGEQLLAFQGPTLPPWLSDLPLDTELAWIGTNPYLKEYYPEQALHLYRASFNNPRPDVEVKSIDYVSTMRPTTAPFIVGMTVE